MIEYAGPPERWIVKHGRPAACLGRHGMPSYEHEDGGLLVFDLLLAQAGFNGGVKLFSRWYGSACVISPDDMVPLHHSPEALWEWRPLVYRRSMYGCWEELGSQAELAWRFGLMEVMHAVHAGAEVTMFEADEKAEKLLAECLSGFQQLELAATDKFRVRGGSTGRMYKIELGDGFDRVDPVTDRIVASYCLHPEYWMPTADVALATKLQLEDPELEEETVAGARAGYSLEVDWSVLAQRDDRVAAKLEEALI